MEQPKYNVQSQQISTILAWVQSNAIAIPEIQRPFVWSAIKVRDFLDSLYNNYPVGYLIAWNNPKVKAKDGKISGGRKILIDGQQRVTALMASLLGEEVVTKEYKKARIKIAFNPQKDALKRFEVSTPIIEKDPQWIPDIAPLFQSGVDLFDLVDQYCEKNPTVLRKEVQAAFNKLVLNLPTNTVGYIELASYLDIETVTEIFIRVNLSGVPLSQADFVMSKIAVNEAYGGNMLRKAIDYFCNLAVAPEFFATLKNDKEFAQTHYFQKMKWLAKDTDNIYDPSYTDLLRVAFATGFKRGRLADLVALLSGRNFETKQYEEEIVEQSFGTLEESVCDFMNDTNFNKFVSIIRAAGFVDAKLLGAQNVLNSAYIMYLMMRKNKCRPEVIEKYVPKWVVYSMLTGRYSGAPESSLDYDVSHMDVMGVEAYADSRFETELSPTFWESRLPSDMATSTSTNSGFKLFRVAQAKVKDKGFLSKNITIDVLLQKNSDVHHLFPKEYLKKAGLPRSQYNQVANFAVTQSEINIAIGKKVPCDYMGKVLKQCNGGKTVYGGITDLDELKENLRQNCIPEGFVEMTKDDYQDFLVERRKLMAAKIREYFYAL